MNLRKAAQSCAKLRKAAQNYVSSALTLKAFFNWFTLTNIVLLYCVCLTASAQGSYFYWFNNTPYRTHSEAYNAMYLSTMTDSTGLQFIGEHQVDAAHSVFEYEYSRYVERIVLLGEEWWRVSRQGLFPPYRFGRTPEEAWNLAVDDGIGNNDRACDSLARLTFSLQSGYKDAWAAEWSDGLPLFYPWWRVEKHEFSYVGYAFSKDLNKCIPFDYVSEYPIYLSQPLVCPTGSTEAGSGCISDSKTTLSIIKQLEDCPVAPLTPIADITPNDTGELAKTQALERGESAYDQLSDGMKSSEQCMSQKFSAKNIGYRLTATYRSAAYQKHLSELWEKWKAIHKLPKVSKMFCEKLINDLDQHQGADDPDTKPIKCNVTGGRAHCVKSSPAKTEPKHTTGDAVDISEKNVNALKKALKNDVPAQTVQGYMDADPSCSVTWGGPWTPPDPVHFKHVPPPTPTP